MSKAEIFFETADPIPAHSIAEAALNIPSGSKGKPAYSKGQKNRH